MNHGGEALQPNATATSVRIRDGHTVTTDGPFAETKEGLGGFYILDCKDLDDELACAAHASLALAICFGNETTCDGGLLRCNAGLLCAISLSDARSDCTTP